MGISPTTTTYLVLHGEALNVDRRVYHFGIASIDLLDPSAYVLTVRDVEVGAEGGGAVPGTQRRAEWRQKDRPERPPEVLTGAV